jgi:hypothetical protein
MVRQVVFVSLALVLFGLGPSADAQGRRPSGAQPGAAVHRPSMTRVEPRAAATIGRRDAAARGEDASAARRQAAEARREAARENDKSAEARAAHPPNEHAAEAAFLAEQNADHRDTRQAGRSERRSGRSARNAE